MKDLSPKLQWTRGRGEYVGTDGSTFVVRAMEGGAAVMVFVSGSPFGHGSTARSVTRRDGKLVVAERHSFSAEDVLPEIVLENGMAGWWEPSGGVVYANTEPIIAPVAQPKGDRRTPGGEPEEEEVVTQWTLPTDGSLAPAKGVTSDVVIPDSVDQLVERIAAQFVIVAGPNRAVLIGRPNGDRYDWQRADAAETGLFGFVSLRIEGQYKNAILTRLRRKAMRTVSAVQFHPRSEVGGKIIRRRGMWVHVDTGGAEQEICGAADAVIHDVQWISRQRANRRLGVGESAGDWRRIMGVIVDGHQAYVGFDDPLEILIPCEPGNKRHVIYVVERSGPGEPVQYEVYGVTVSRGMNAGAQGTVALYEGPMKPGYFPYTFTKSGVQKFTILYLG